MLSLIDTHCHLTDKIYPKDNTIIDDMQKDGLSKVITVGYDMQSSQLSTQLSSKHKNVYAAVGIHPDSADQATAANIESLLTLCANPKTVAFGEVGLDYHYPNGFDAAVQKQALIAQIEAAENTGLPLIFHIRDSFGDMTALLKENAKHIKNGGVAHCYSGSIESAREYLKRGIYISFSGSITFKNAEKLRTVAKFIPKDMTLCETDSPYLCPNRGQTNYPRYVHSVAQELASIWEVDLQSAIQTLNANAYRLFTRLSN